jgi:hypothetical protein
MNNQGQNQTATTDQPSSDAAKKQTLQGPHINLNLGNNNSFVLNNSQVII